MCAGYMISWMITLVNDRRLVEVLKREVVGWSPDNQWGAGWS